MTAPTLTSKLDLESPEAKANAVHNRVLADSWRMCGMIWFTLSADLIILRAIFHSPGGVQLGLIGVLAIIGGVT